MWTRNEVTKVSWGVRDNGEYAMKHMHNKLIIYTDGGSRGNPGPAAIGVVVAVPGKPEKEYGEYIGRATNNQAEDRAALFGLKKAKQLLGGKGAEKTEIEVR